MDNYFLAITAHFQPDSTGWGSDSRAGFYDRIVEGLAQDLQVVDVDFDGNLRAWRADVCDPASSRVTVMGVIGPIESTGGSNEKGQSIVDSVLSSANEAGAISATVDVHPPFLTGPRRFGVRAPSFAESRPAVVARVSQWQPTSTPR